MHPLTLSRYLSAGFLFLLGLGATHADAPWPHLLGPNRNGISTETGLNLDWKKTPPKTLWKQPLGSAFSSVAVLDDRLITMAQRGKRDFVVCLGTADGKELWTYDAAPTWIDVQKHGYGPRSTPTVSGEHVYCLLPRGELFCLKVKDGSLVWKADIIKDTGAKSKEGQTYYWGLCSSPLVEGDVVITHPGGNKDNSIVAFNRHTGKIAWGVGNDAVGYGSPILITLAGKRQVVCPTGQSLLGIDPVKGELLWRYPFGNPFDATCITPVWTDGLLFISAAYTAGSAVIEIVERGGKYSVQEKWKNKTLQALMATPIVHEGYVYGCSGDIGVLTLRCLDLKTGEEKWSQRQPGRVCFVAAEGHLICLGERGTLQLLELNPSRQVIKGELPNLLTYRSWAIPALAGKRLYLRDQKQLLCLDLSKG
jgi:outer membrane protein assembly factor BamB